MVYGLWFMVYSLWQEALRDPILFLEAGLLESRLHLPFPPNRPRYRPRPRYRFFRGPPEGAALGQRRLKIDDE
jgi:hypothetical protein